ncbi:clathrin light chain isoform X3 [Tribolium castaneum]|uniref:clathrin light chain isoform X3 n=1 Tax=Tribolium castaneum TaxID=7070 RepID=UPI00077DE90C|nr:PREDICTED: clathrin light chain isoform X3 [Tribolium castaneum]|eukprot:XP_015834773.1 PREDICTED: clathrin light chain isoform X3 [Tribolium castaneum]
MSNFGDAFDQPEVDPAAEFLAREQDDLAGLEDEVKPAAISAPVVNGDDPTNSASSFEMVEGFEDGTSIKREEFDVSPSPPPLNREVREEPEKIKKWREEQIKRLEEKDAEEEKKKLELREIARKELEEWYKNHEEAIAKTKAANRDAAKNAEKQFVAEDDEIVPGTEWERIAKLCDFNPKAKQGSKDVSRMRSIVLQLKQSPIPINNKA